MSKSALIPEQLAMRIKNIRSAVEASGYNKAREKILNRQNGGRWYSINNKDGDVAEVRIYDVIGFWGITAEDFVNELDEITAPEMVVAINSPGGDVFDGITIFNALRLHPAKVTTRVDGLAASAASFIAQAGDHRVMVQASQMMIHNAWGLAIGDARVMREVADILEQQDGVIAGIYAARSDRDEHHFRTLMDAETWLTDEETVAEGLADEVFDPSAKADDPVALVPAANRTLNDEITEGMDVLSRITESAQRVAALRAEKGKGLSQVNRSSLDELTRTTERLQSLLTIEDSLGGEESTTTVSPERRARLQDIEARWNQLQATSTRSVAALERLSGVEGL